MVLCVQGQAYTDAGATAYDAVDGALNNIITTGLSSVNTMVVCHVSALAPIEYIHALQTIADHSQCRACSKLACFSFGCL